MAVVPIEKSQSRYAEWAGAKLLKSATDNRLAAAIIPLFAQYFLTHANRTDDLDMIAGDFVCNQPAMASDASDQLRGICSDAGSDVSSWTGTENGELMRLAATACDVFVTMDQASCGASVSDVGISLR